MKRFNWFIAKIIVKIKKCLTLVGWTNDYSVKIPVDNNAFRMRICGNANRHFGLFICSVILHKIWNFVGGDHDSMNWPVWTILIRRNLPRIKSVHNF